MQFLICQLSDDHNVLLFSQNIINALTYLLNQNAPLLCLYQIQHLTVELLS